MQPAKHIPSRRAFLRGTGALLTLPVLDSLGRGTSAAAEDRENSHPRRMAFLYVPNGVNVNEWKVEGAGKDYKLGSTLKALEPHKSDFTVISGLNHDKATPGDDGAGDHSRATATFLTGCRAKKTAGADIRLGVSIDQIAAQQIGHLTRLPSLELSTDRQRTSGRCDSGYSCAYQFNLSWKTETMPLAAETNPRLVFERLFGGGAIGGRSGDPGKRRDLQKSVLDFVLDDARSLGQRLNAMDKRKLEQYLHAVRDIEKRIAGVETVVLKNAKLKKPTTAPRSYQEHIRMMLDLLALAFQTDSTRIVTFMLAHDGSNHSFPEIGIPEAHHQISHHRGDKAKLKKIARIDRFYIEQLVYFLERMKSMREGDSNMLDRSLIVYGSGISEGNKHWHNNLPIILAGKGGGSLHPGRHLQVSDPTPMTNLYMALLKRMGIRAQRVGDSTGALESV